jgi:hypothetical protein
MELVDPALDVDFYQSSTDGPTLRMAGTLDGMRSIRSVCEGLAGGQPSVSVLDLAGVHASEHVEVVEFRLGSADGLCRQTEPAHFVFDGDAAQWELRARLLDPLVEPGATGFQYLEPNVAEGISVEVERIR